MLINGVEVEIAPFANLIKANLFGANLRGANLSGANLEGANLREADLSVANLLKADLLNADLRGADLREANLSRANLRGANLSRADLSGANLSGANLSGTVLIDGGQRSDAYRFVGWVYGGVLQSRARCRSLSSADARAHWQKTRANTPLGDETLAILDHIERVARIRGLIKGD